MGMRYCALCILNRTWASCWYRRCRHWSALSCFPNFGGPVALLLLGFRSSIFSRLNKLTADKWWQTRTEVRAHVFSILVSACFTFLRKQIIRSTISKGRCNIPLPSYQEHGMVFSFLSFSSRIGSIKKKFERQMSLIVFLTPEVVKIPRLWNRSTVHRTLCAIRAIILTIYIIYIHVKNNGILNNK